MSAEEPHYSWREMYRRQRVDPDHHEPATGGHNE